MKFEKHLGYRSPSSVIFSGAVHSRSPNGKRVECPKSKSQVSSACAISHAYFAARLSLHVYRKSCERRMRGLENEPSFKSLKAMGSIRSTDISGGSFRTLLLENRASQRSLLSSCRSGLERPDRHDVLASWERTLESAGRLRCAVPQCERVGRSGECSRPPRKARYTAVRSTSGVSAAACNLHNFRNRRVGRAHVAWDRRHRVCRIVSIRRCLDCMSVGCSPSTRRWFARCCRSIGRRMHGDVLSRRRACSL